MHFKAGDTVVFSRTDSIGDVMLSLPVITYLKSQNPEVKVVFLGAAYTKAVVECCASVDVFVDVKEAIASPELLARFNPTAVVFLYPDKAAMQLAKSVGIPLRVATANRVHSWLYANKRISFSRKNSDLHESQLNFYLLQGLGIKHLPTLLEVKDLIEFHAKPVLPSEVKDLLQSDFIILHPKSKGSAREWPLSRYLSLAQMLGSNGYQVVITGTEAEGERIQDEMPDFFAQSSALDLTGKLNLAELVALIAQSSALVACSTGPLHIASALNRVAVGLYPGIKPMHEGRWGPIGKRSKAITFKTGCNACAKTNACECMAAISAAQVLATIEVLSNSSITE